MDYNKFINGLSYLYENWETDLVMPKSPKFKNVIETIQGMTTPNVMQLLNYAVQCLDGKEIYCEIGSFHGSTLIGALLDNPTVTAYAIDNFSEFDRTGENFEKLTDNLSRYQLEDQVVFCNQDFEEFFFDLQAVTPDFKIGVYLYDGAHDYRSQLLGLTMVVPFLADQALIIVDDSNWANVQQANFDFLATYPHATLAMNLPTRKDQDDTFWNGLHIITWDANTYNQYKWQDFSSQFRHHHVIQSIYNLSWEFELKQKPQVICELEQQALLLENKNQISDAELIYEEILQWSINHSLAWYRLGLIAYQRRDYLVALDRIQKSLQVDSSNGDAHFLYSFILNALGNDNKANESYHYASNRFPELKEKYSLKL